VKPGSPTKAGASVITRVASKTPSGPASLHKAGVAVVSAVAMRGRTTTSTQQRLRAQDDRAAHEEADAVRRREEALAKKAEEEATATMESLKASVRPPGSCRLLPCYPLQDSRRTHAPLRLALPSQGEVSGHTPNRGATCCREATPRPYSPVEHPLPRASCMRLTAPHRVTSPHEGGGKA
jgi:hypothetical protein